MPRLPELLNSEFCFLFSTTRWARLPPNREHARVPAQTELRPTKGTSSEELQNTDAPLTPSSSSSFSICSDFTAVSLMWVHAFTVGRPGSLGSDGASPYPPIRRAVACSGQALSVALRLEQSFSSLILQSSNTPLLHSSTPPPLHSSTPLPSIILPRKISFPVHRRGY
jgi:hypothetical protein